PAAAWEGAVLPLRVRGYKREWLDQVVLSGEAAWARLWGAGTGPIRRTPICLLQREELEAWLGLAGGITRPEPTGTARAVYEVLTARGALFFPELSSAVKLPQAYLEVSLSELIGLGHVTCDSFGGLRWMIFPAWRRKGDARIPGRWSALRHDGPPAGAESVARQ